MEHQKSTQPSCDSSGDDTALAVPDLDLPVDAGIRSLPPLISISEMIKRSQELRRCFPQGVPTEAERLAAKIHEEFIL